MRLAQTLAFGVALLGSGVALAQPAAPPAAAAPTATAPTAATSAAPAPGGRLFALMDANHDGRVTWDEAWTFITARFNTADADHSGGLTLQEFSTLRMGHRPEGRPEGRDGRRGGPAPERMEAMRSAMFRSLDANSDGVVTLAEIQPFAQARFRALDANGDGAVTRDELPRHGRHDRHHGHRGERGERAAPAAPANPAAPAAPAR